MSTPDKADTNRQDATAGCPICGAKASRLLFFAGPLDYALATQFAILRCSGCGHGTTVLAPDTDLGPLYEGGNYDTTEGFLRRLLRPLLDRTEFNKVRALQRWLRTGRLLEIGAGKGRFLRAAQRSGFTVRGLEPSARSRVFAQRAVGSVVTGDTLEEYAARCSDKFDAICLWHVLEHLPDIGGALARIRGLLADGGVLMVGVPNFQSLQARLGRRLWYHLDPPRHLHHFTAASLGRSLGSAGFSLVETSHRSFFQNWLGELVTLLNLVSPEPNALLNLARRNASMFSPGRRLRSGLAVAWGVVLLPVVIPATLLVAWITERHGNSGTMIVFARRDGR